MLTELILDCPKHWKNYELLDCGDFEKLEKFGDYVLRRPEPQAFWPKKFSESKWKKAHAQFQTSGSHSGDWIGNMPEKWEISYQHPAYKLKFHLSKTKFKHVGLFPEQAANWDFLFTEAQKREQSKFLNLFAYTGAASLAAARAGAAVTHIDSIKQVVSWARQNAESNHIQNIRWIVEDAFTFVKNEVKRGKKYQGIALDPPAWGHGPNGEKWKLEDMISDLLKETANILDPETGFFLINTYSLNLSPLVVSNLIQAHFEKFPLKTMQTGELFVQASSGYQLPTGVFARLTW